MDNQDNQAVPVNFNAKKIFEKIKSKIEVEEKREARKDADLIELASSPLWETYKKIVERRIEILKTMIDSESGESMISFNDSPFMIGLKFLIISFTIYQLRQMIELPEAVRDARKLEAEDVNE